MKEEKNSGRSESKWTAKRIVALAAVVVLLGLYAAAFLSAIFARPGAGQLFRFCLGMTIAVPIFAWILIWAIGVMSHRHTIASLDILNSNPDARREMEEGVEREMGAGAAQEPEDSSKI